MRGGFVAWLLSLIAGTATAIFGGWLFRSGDPFFVGPIAQAVGFFVASMVSWPLWFRYQPRRRVGFLGFAVSLLSFLILTAAVRIAWRIG
jgi:hypothetical protein